ncbi:uncharacterized protein [Typha latifolia]|uniref:uncharacterized protein n=1 Tax=Typha latifolia TaxID=4733 RepID=UPI003C2BE4C3
MHHILNRVEKIVLIFFGKYRTRNGSRLVASIMWLAYLLADRVATFALGLLSNNRNNTSFGLANRDLHAFWAPFLLLHLGGPDTITAFSLEDNELWRRHLLELVFQVTMAIYVFVGSWSSTKLLVPAIPMFLARIIKYAEKTWALWHASEGILRKSLVTNTTPRPNYVEVTKHLCRIEDVKERERKQDECVAEIDINREIRKRRKRREIAERVSYLKYNMHTKMEDVSRLENLLNADDFFQIDKRLIMGLILDFKDRQSSQPFFLECSTSKAFKVIEIELSFVYEMLYTKSTAIHTKLGPFLRCFTLAFILSSLIAFLIIKKHSYGEVDIVITYILLGGAVLLEFYSVGLLVFSKWGVIRLHNLKYFSWLSNIIFSIMSFFDKQSKPRWSNSMGQCNLITFCLSDRSPTSTCTLKEIWDKLWHTKSYGVTNELKDFIFKVLKEASRKAIVSKDYKYLTTCRGMDTLEEMGKKDVKTLVDSVNNIEFDRSILLWHIASDLCYHSTVQNLDSSTQKQSMISKELSDYMLYLLIVRHSMLIAGTGQIRYGDTCAEAKRFFDENDIQSDEEKKACEELLKVDTLIPSAKIKGDASKSVLFDAVILAKELLKLEEERRWELMSRVWVEMLCFAATHCRGFIHAKQLSDGGELLTFVWLLIAHLGMGEQYMIEQGELRLLPPTLSSMQRSLGLSSVQAKAYKGSPWSVTPTPGSTIAKRLIVGLVLNCNDRLLSLPFFYNCSTSQAFKNKRRWSNSMGQCNLITSCLSGRSPTSTSTLKEVWDELSHTKSIDVTDELKYFIFIVLKEVSMTANVSADFKHFTTCRGMDTLEKMDSSTQRQRMISKALSDYMLYLLIVHHFTLTAGIGQIRYRNTHAEAKQFFDENDIQSDEEKKACEELLKVDTLIPPSKVKGDANKSVLFNAVILAKELLKLEEEERWELMSHVWVEMLCFAATHCRRFIHAKQLSDGGELLTIVWLLIAHLGMGEQYMIERIILEITII